MKHIQSPKFDGFLIYSPYMLPIIFCSLFLLPGKLPAFAALFALYAIGESHFGSTWLFFMDPDNATWIKANSYKVIILPIYFLSAISILWFVQPSFVFLFHYVASGWHVTRQSVAVNRLKGSRSDVSQRIIYMVSGLFLVIGIASPGFMQQYLTYDQSLYLLLAFFFIASLLSRLIPSKSAFITGISIYLPVIFFKNLLLATVVGVGMHWLQYLAITWSVHVRKLRNPLHDSSSLSTRPVLIRFIFIILYSSVMGFCSYSYSYSGGNSVVLGSLFLLPLLFQFYHFYIDGFIWKFSDPHIRSSIGHYMYPNS